MTTSSYRPRFINLPLPRIVPPAPSLTFLALNSILHVCHPTDHTQEIATAFEKKEFLDPIPFRRSPDQSHQENPYLVPQRKILVT